MARRTPDDLVIRPRNLAFHRGPSKPDRSDGGRWWANGDPIATAFYNAMSVTFPKGERFFMDSVRTFRDAADPRLQEEIKAFVAQEAMHTREHVVFNEAVTAQGYDITALEAFHDQMLAEARARHPVAQLASTMALEHFTAIIAHELLANPSHLKAAPEETARLWRWHAMEEIEHKAVAFDTFMAAMKAASPWKRWQVRVRVMALVSVRFWRIIGFGMVDLLRQDGIDARARRGDIARFLLLRPGMLARALPAYFSFFWPGFHPWALDDRALIVEEQARADVQLAAAA